eukprot:403356361
MFQGGISEPKIFLQKIKLQEVGYGFISILQSGMGDVTMKKKKEEKKQNSQFIIKINEVR